MGLVAKKQGNKAGNFVKQDNIAAGVYPGRLVQLIDLGLQAQRAFQGKDKPPAQEIMLTYELVDEFMKDEDGNEIKDKPRWVSETLPFFGLYADKAKSTQRYHAFDPKEDFGGDFSKCIEMPVNITIVNNPAKDGRIFDNVANIAAMRPRDAAACPELVNASKVFDLENPDIEVFNSLPEWIREKIKSNLNYAGSPLERLLAGRPDAPKEQAKPAKQEKKEKAPPVDDDMESQDDNPY